jgi:hypothetical protein
MKDLFARRTIGQSLEACQRVFDARPSGDAILDPHRCDRGCLRASRPS